MATHLRAVAQPDRETVAQAALCWHRLSEEWEHFKERVEQYPSSYEREALDLLRYVSLL